MAGAIPSVPFLINGLAQSWQFLISACLAAVSGGLTGYLRPGRVSVSGPLLATPTPAQTPEQRLAPTHDHRWQCGHQALVRCPIRRALMVMPHLAQASPSRP